MTMNGIYASFASGLVALAIAAPVAHAATAEQTLEQKLAQYKQSKTASKPSFSSRGLVSAEQVGIALDQLGSTAFYAAEPTCVESKAVSLDGQFLVTYDAAGNKPCKLYDLSFPTVASMVGSTEVTHIPVQKFSASDMLNWMSGDYDRVYNSIKEFKSNYASAAPEVQAGWVAKLKFREGSKANFVYKTFANGVQLPTEFKASDIELGGKFEFSANERAKLIDTLNKARVSNMLASETADAWEKLVAEPGSIMERIKFVWDDLEKVYKVVMDGDFLPLVGPVSLVDFATPYKPAMQGMVRSMVESAIMKLLNSVILEPTSNKILNVVMTDIFGFVENMYVYQMNLMEGALRIQMTNAPQAAESKVYERGVDLLFSTRTGFFNDYLMAVIQGKKFDWNSLEEKGHKARYAAEKQREIGMNNRNSDLAIKAGCNTQPLYDYFVICNKDGKSQGIYSLLSDYSILFWSFGATKVYNPAFQSEVLVKRATTRILASGLRMVGLPILSSLTDMLANELQTYSMTGVNDEAFLRTSLLNDKRRGALDDQSAGMLKMLYMQNINPLLPKSEESENKIIQKHTPKQKLAVGGQQ
jgi:hypothetical protein